MKKEELADPWSGYDKKDPALSKKITLYLVEFFIQFLIFVAAIWFIISIVYNQGTLWDWTEKWVIICLIILPF
jgi:hypothetical protein